MEATKVNKSEARTLAKYGHSVIASLDENLAITGYYVADKINMATIKKGRRACRAPKSEPIRKQTKLMLVNDIDPHFENPDSFIAKAYKALKPVLTAEKQITRVDLEKYLQSELDLDSTQTANIITHLAHTYKVLEPVY